MEGQVPTSSNDRSRTYWTQTMERYFIDLMLEQMSRGNRVGHTFSKQAWTDMLAEFNVKFGSQYDKEVLKSRYTNLWKQFNDVKELLGHAGFSWDESRQMVVADDDRVWDSYIKIHPDTRSYKTKAVVNFDDLCVIYGYTTADGRYSRSSHDVDFDDEVQGVKLGDGMGIPVPAKNECPRTEWTLAIDQYFIELMIDQIGRGNMPNSSFNKQAWTDMITFFNAKFGPQHDRRVLRHRWKKLSKYYIDLTFLLKQDGFSWDEAQQMVVADDSVWNANTKAHPHIRAYKMKKLPNYNDLALVYGDASENSVQSNSPQKDDGFTGKSSKDETQNQNLGSCDRVRTYWTPPMDRLLIDLLLDHVHKGNKFGKTFVTQAWTEMAASFNAKIQSSHGKEIFKNRYKHLRRLYNDIKNLLENSGFSWDETREMVTAEDYVWDAHIKVNPNARSFRVKTVPSYQKLCVIFGPETSDGRYSRLARTTGPNDETSVLMTDESNIDPTKVDWQPELDCYFIDLMLEQVQHGNKTDNTFNEEAWHHMTESINEKFGILSTKCSLEDRYSSLMKECDNISHLLGQGGFTWDVNQQMLLADDPVWEASIKEQPDVAVYRNKVLHNYVDLYQIQRNQVSCSKGHSAPDAETQIGNCDILDLDGLDGDYQFPVDDDTLMADEPSKQLTAEQPSGFELERPCKLQKISSNNKEMAGAVTVERAIEALQAIPDIDDELLLDGCDLLEDERKAKTFLALDTLLRKKWLLRKLRP